MTPSFTFGLLLATLYGALFHLWQGGTGQRLALYLLSGWLGFAIGQIIGDTLGITMLSIGPLHALSATFGSLVALFTALGLARSTSGPPSAH